ncbi:tRNA pseudouridine(55) synthase TruB [soil metagenome]
MRPSDYLCTSMEKNQVLLINKPYDWTSFDVVKYIRNALKGEKIGHAGTLDPLATGLLILCTGSMTKKISEIQDAEKEYTGIISLGATTPSYDLETEVSERKDISSITPDQILAAAKQFTGEIQQIPPTHSAIKIGGRRAYAMARNEEVFEMKSKQVTISVFEITRIELPDVHFRIVCSKGTYIRSIANDIGQLLGCGAYLGALCRTRIGNFLLKDALDPSQFSRKPADSETLKD